LLFAKIDIKIQILEQRYTTKTETDRITKRKIYKYFLSKNTTRNTIERKTPTMNNIKTVPNQKVITVKKEKTDEKNYYCKINLSALEYSAIDLQSGAFKLWIYLAKNQPNYTFGLSSKALEENFGMKIKQYNNAVAELIEKGYLIKQKGNSYFFSEKPIKDNTVITKKDNENMTKSNNEILPKDTRNTIDITINTTKENTFIF
jgi:hypothetical protein